MRIVHEINTACTVVAGDSGPDSPVTVTIHCLKGPRGWPQVRDDIIEIEGDPAFVRAALEEALQQLNALELAD